MSRSESAPRGVWAVFGRGLLLVHTSVSHLCPHLHASLHALAMGLPGIDSPFTLPLFPWCSIHPAFFTWEVAPAVCLSLKGQSPGLTSSTLHPCGWKTAECTCVRCVLGLVIYAPSVQVSGT